MSPAKHKTRRLAAAMAFAIALPAAAPGAAQAQGCRVADGTARSGAVVGTSPTRYKYAQSPYLGARFSSCLGNVRVYFGDSGTAGSGVRYRVNYGQRRISSIPIFSHTRELSIPTGGLERRVTIFSTRDVRANVYAFFRVQRCFSNLLAPSTCSPWSPVVTVSLGANELTAY